MLALAVLNLHYLNVPMSPCSDGDSFPDPLTFTVTTGGDRLDRWLAQAIPPDTGFSRSRLQKLIDQGQVQVNDRIETNKNSKVQQGDQIHITLPEPEPLDLVPETMDLNILYEDDHLILLNKPKGLVVHPAPGHSQGTLVNGLLAHCPHLPGIGGIQRPGIVHRLDKDTSGVMVVAKTDQALLSLQGQIREKTAQREYFGIVHGAMKEEAGRVEQPVGRHPVDRKRMAIVAEENGGRWAATQWQVQERLGNYTLVQFHLETGRTHQIRVHCAWLGHAIVGDALYGSGRSMGVKLQGQALHAYALRLQHPATGEPLEAIAPLPPEFLTLVQVLRRRA